MNAPEELFALASQALVQKTFGGFTSGVQRSSRRACVGGNRSWMLNYGKKTVALGMPEALIQEAYTERNRVLKVIVRNEKQNRFLKAR